MIIANKNTVNQEQALELENKALKGEVKRLTGIETYHKIKRQCAKNKAERQGRTRHFTKVYQSALKPVSKILTMPEMCLAFMLLPYVDFGTNYLVNSNNKMSQKDIIELAQPVMSKRYVQDIIQSLVAKGYFFKESRGRQNQYRANPMYFFAGREEDNNYKETSVA